MILTNISIHYDPKADRSERYTANVLVTSDAIRHTASLSAQGPHEALAAAIRQAASKHTDVLIEDALKRLEVRA